MVKRRPTRTKAGLASGEEMIRFEVKSWARKNQALKKLGDARGERNGAERRRTGSGFSRFVNGDDSGRFPTRGEGVRGPRPVEKEKEGGVVRAKANALVKDRQSGQGQTQ